MEMLISSQAVCQRPRRETVDQSELDSVDGQIFVKFREASFSETRRGSHLGPNEESYCQIWVNLLPPAHCQQGSTQHLQIMEDGWIPIHYQTGTHHLNNDHNTLTSQKNQTKQTSSTSLSRYPLREQKSSIFRFNSSLLRTPPVKIIHLEDTQFAASVQFSIDSGIVVLFFLLKGQIAL